jgi:hypothetical protein
MCRSTGNNKSAIKMLVFYFALKASALDELAKSALIALKRFGINIMNP